MPLLSSHFFLNQKTVDIMFACFCGNKTIPPKYFAAMERLFFLQIITLKYHENNRPNRMEWICRTFENFSPAICSVIFAVLHMSGFVFSLVVKVGLKKCWELYLLSLFVFFFIFFQPFFFLYSFILSSFSLSFFS